MKSVESFYHPIPLGCEQISFFIPCFPILFLLFFSRAHSSLPPLPRGFFFLRGPSHSTRTQLERRSRASSTLCQGWQILLSFGRFYRSLAPSLVKRKEEITQLKFIKPTSPHHSSILPRLPQALVVFRQIPSDSSLVSTPTKTFLTS